MNTNTRFNINYSFESTFGSPFERSSIHEKLCSNNDITTTASTVKKTTKKKSVEKKAVENDDSMCCVCYNESKAFQFKTHCNHNLCVVCLLQLPKHECPMCRSIFPESLRQFLPEKNKDEEDDEDNSNTILFNIHTGELEIVNSSNIPQESSVNEPQPIYSQEFNWNGSPARW